MLIGGPAVAARSVGAGVVWANVACVVWAARRVNAPTAAAIRSGMTMEI
jgi:hypothetical protein